MHGGQLLACAREPVAKQTKMPPNQLQVKVITSVACCLAKNDRFLSQIRKIKSLPVKIPI